MYDTTPLYHAVTFKSKHAVNTLLKAGAWLTIGSCYQTELHEAAANGSLDILETFFNDPRITVEDINKTDAYRRTPLHRAALGGHKDCIKALLNRGGSLIGSTRLSKETVMDVIFAHIPRPADFIKEIFDSKITKTPIPRQEGNSIKVTLDFSVLAPHGNERQMDVLWSMFSAATEKEKVTLLQHPLIESFLHLKWAKIRPFFYLLIATYTLFVLCLSAYVVLGIHNVGKFPILTSVFRMLVFLTGGGLFIHALIQFILSIRKHFFRQHELWMNLTNTGLAVVIAISGFSGHAGLPATSYEDLPEWTLHCASVAVLLSWSELMLLIGRSPSYGYYALMFAAVLQNILKVLLTFVCLVIGFALSFSIQFYGFEEFTNPWHSVVKTTVMMMGEFEYTDLFKGREEEQQSRLRLTSRIVFMCFIILASIVLMNLMVGVAVSDIQGLQEEGHGRRLEKQAEFIRQFEKVISVKVVDSKWFPNIIRRYLRRRGCIHLQLMIQPELTGYRSFDEKSTRKLPLELVESIVSMATNKDENADVFRNVRLEEIVEALKAVLCNNNNPERRITR
ncbi:transient receptor potential channel pyrexia-like [Photinus pyralis]|uniref:transient receptor potential channel pyrexia-like n=1 Tax=Photinus pyralis TaxID=7054 RepID=UPI0012675178|nr:transient receptor potential channel pyrexia-like [Photinus pyralis]